MPEDPDPLDFDESARGERQTSNQDSTDEFADEAERLDAHTKKAGDSQGQSRSTDDDAEREST